MPNVYPVSNFPSSPVEGYAYFNVNSNTLGVYKNNQWIYFEPSSYKLPVDGYLDFDGDGVLNKDDSNPNDPNTSGLDSDGDGVDDAVDPDPNDPNITGNEINDITFNNLAAGGGHSLYLKSDGSLWAMGRNLYGQLGDGSTSDRVTPVQAKDASDNPITDVVNVTADSSHSLYLKSDGSLWAMGRNNNGQLGDGSTSDRVTPVEIETGGVASVSAGGNHSLYLKSDGSLWAMGRNSYGQFGNGTATNATAPIFIFNL